MGGYHNLENGGRIYLDTVCCEECDEPAVGWNDDGAALCEGCLADLVMWRTEDETNGNA